MAATFWPSVQRFTAASPRPPLPPPVSVFGKDFLEGAAEEITSTPTPESQPTGPKGVRFGNNLVRHTGPADNYYDRVYVTPTAIEAGIILAEQVFTVTIFNAFRAGSIDWTNFVSSFTVADGVTFETPVPPPTITIPALGAAVRTITIDQNGSPTVSGSFDLTILDPDITPLGPRITVMGIRSVVFPFQPERPVRESLRAVTDTLESLDGTQQRRALRRNLRSTYRYNFDLIEDDKRRYDSLIFDFQGSVVGVGVITEAVDLLADLSPGESLLTVSDTSDTSLAVGGLVLIWESSDSFVPLQVDSFTANTITLTTTLSQSFSAGALVMPLRNSILQERVVGNRYRSADRRVAICEFLVTNNEPDLEVAPSALGFDTYTPPGGSERILLDDPNIVLQPTIQERVFRNTIVLDNAIGAPEIFTENEVSRPETVKTFRTQSRSALRRLRRFLHTVRLAQVSFYLPTGGRDLRPAVDINPTDMSIVVAGLDYVNHVRSRQPKNIIRVRKFDGTFGGPYFVTDAVESAGNSQLNIDMPTGITATVAEIERIEYVEKVHGTSDQIDIIHEDTNGKALCSIPVMASLEDDS